MIRPLTFIGCLAFMGGAAEAKCKKGTFPIVRRSSTRVEYACRDRKGLWQGLVVAKNLKGELLSVGKYKDGKPEGVWTFFDGHGHVVGHPIFQDGAMVASDSMRDDEADDGGGSE